MANHDYVIDNQSAPAFRADLNNVLAAIVTQNSSAIAPTVTFANMLWYDTANNQIKKRNEANSDWVVLGTVDEAAGTFTPTGLPPIATQPEAEAGTDNTKTMTPLRVAQAIAALGAKTPAYQVFTASGTWTKPTGYPDDTMVTVEMWGGGGGGNRTGTGGNVSAGGGGAYATKRFRLGDLASTVAVTVGAGGAGRKTTNGAGTAGGNSSFGSLLTAYGGGGGASNTGLPAGGGGELGAGTSSAGGELGGGYYDADWGIDMALKIANDALTPFGGGGGGGSNTTAVIRAGNAIYGGGGGGSGTNAGGTSVYGGNGGAGGTNNGSVPAGGGGARFNTNGGDGARGEVRIWIG